ncbi:MAG: DUF2007 domain-containing protein [Pseudomonadota bacterium]
MDDVLNGALVSPMDLEAIPGRDLFMVAQYLIPIDAYLAQGCLVAAGIPAVVADANHAQADQLILPAMGGVRVLVPESFMQQSQEVLAARERGDYALADDADVGEQA